MLSTKIFLDDHKFKLLSNGSCNSSYIAAIYCLIYFFFFTGDDDLNEQYNTPHGER